MAIAHTGANCHDSEMAIPLVDAVPSIKQPRGRPRRRPDEVLADRAYDAAKREGIDFVVNTNPTADVRVPGNVCTYCTETRCEGMPPMMTRGL